MRHCMLCNYLSPGATAESNDRREPQIPFDFRIGLTFRLLPGYSMHGLKWPYAKQGKYVTRFVSRRLGDDDSRIAAPPAGARICLGPAHPATLEQPAPGRGGIAVSGLA